MAEDMDVDLRSMLDVQREIDGVQRKIDEVERKIDEVELQLSSATDPEEKKYLRDEKMQLRALQLEKEKQLRDEKMQLRALQLEKEKQRTLAKVPPATDLQAAPVAHLLHLFQKQLQHARKAPQWSELSAMRTSDVLKLDRNGDLEAELGTYFTLVGRKNSLRAQITGAAHIFDNFMSSTKPVLRRSTAMLMLVGFPGVGKTTMGFETASLLHQLWTKNEAEVDQLLRGVLSEEMVSDFRTLVENSKSFHCRMFREIETAADGQTIHEEKGLGPQQLLALNVLYACLDCSRLDDQDAPQGDFVLTYRDMLRLCSAVKDRLTLDDVVDFIRSGLGIPPAHRILLSVFFDEANKARPLTGKSASWFQEMMSSYVDWFHANHRGNTFMVITVATTRFAVATLQGTASGMTRSIFIPVPPLTNKQSESVVLQFLKRLHRTLNRGPGSVELSEDLKQVISLSAGNPRMLAYLLRSFCTSSPHVSINPQNLYRALCQGSISKEGMEAVILRAWKQIASSYYAYYMEPRKRRLVLRALQASLLGETVHRSLKVSPDFEDNWGNLEGMGLVGLRSDGTPKVAETPDTIPVMVSFSTMILRHIFSLSDDTLSTLLPPLESSDWKVKEKADLYTIMFMIRLHFEVSGRPTFKLADVLPRGWFIPEELRELEFFVPTGSWRVKQATQLKSPAAFWRFMGENSSQWAFIGPHNWGADSWLRLVCTSTKRVMLLVLESKCCGRPETLPVVNYMGRGGILEKAGKDLKAMIDAGFGMDQVVFVYMSDQNIQSALEEHKSASGEQPSSTGSQSGSEEHKSSECAAMTGVASRLIIAGEHPSSSPLCNMSAIRHMMVFTPKDNLFFNV